MKMPENGPENGPTIGLIGLGTMGAALALNIAEKGFPIAVWNRTTSVTHAFKANAGDLAPRITPTESLAALVAAIKPPRAIILMVPAGAAVTSDGSACTRAANTASAIRWLTSAAQPETGRGYCASRKLLAMPVTESG